jgi:hypothetical protein
MYYISHYRPLSFFPQFTDGGSCQFVGEDDKITILISGGPPRRAFPIRCAFLSTRYIYVFEFDYHAGPHRIFLLSLIRTTSLTAMSVVSLAVREGNPVTEDTVRQLAAKISTGMEIKDPQDVKDFATILAAFHDSALSVVEMDDYVPPSLVPDLERYPRENISYPEKDSLVRDFDSLYCIVFDGFNCSAGKSSQRMGM